MVLPRLNVIKGFAIFSGAGNVLQRNGKSLLMMASQHSDKYSHIIHESTRLIAFGGACVLTGAYIFSIINVMIVIVNSLFLKKFPMVMELVREGSGLTGKKKEATIGRVRMQLGEITALGLEILVVADIMESLTKNVEDFSWNSLGKMAAIAVFRTGLAYALGQEVREIEEKLDEAEELKTKKIVAKSLKPKNHIVQESRA